MRVAIGDMKLPENEATSTRGVPPFVTDEKAVNDYYPYGMTITDRSYQTAAYRYGYNGKENDNEVKGTGNQIDYGFRIYDPRIAKFLSVDPLTKGYPMLTPYQFASNRPIDGIDLDGKEWSSSGKYMSYDGNWHIDYNIKLELINNSKVFNFVETENIENLKVIQTNTGQEFANKDAGGNISEPVINVNTKFTTNTGSKFTMTLKDDLKNSQGNAKGGEMTGDNGNTQVNNVDVSYSRGGTKLSPYGISQVTSHELGHTAGLRHPFDPKNQIKDVRQDLVPYPAKLDLKENLMNSYANPIIPMRENGRVLTKSLRNYVETEVQQDQKKAKENESNTNKPE